MSLTIASNNSSGLSFLTKKPNVYRVNKVQLNKTSAVVVLFLWHTTYARNTTTVCGKGEGRMNPPPPIAHILFVEQNRICMCVCVCVCVCVSHFASTSCVSLSS